MVYEHCGNKGVGGGTCAEVSRGGYGIWLELGVERFLLLHELEVRRAVPVGVPPTVPTTWQVLELEAVADFEGSVVLERGLLGDAPVCEVHGGAETGGWAGCGGWRDEGTTWTNAGSDAFGGRWTDW